MTLEQLKNELHNYYQFDITSKSRKREIVYAKKVFCKIGYELGYTYDKVAKVLNSNHDLAIYHCSTINCIEDRDKMIFDKIIDDYGLFIPKFNAQKKRRIIKGIQDNLEKQKSEEYKDLITEINKTIINWDRNNIREFIDTRLKVYDKALNNKIKPKKINKVPGARLIRKVKNTLLS
tara:strand:- start:1912 stop:2442 length:531 start_codon:yes stop_codon:yes gene_type:complete